mmetsp:Transcript_27301/g.68534  ORF Transcript_27301/g.68534 Transcript_27301/m.68534 type:complete len:81 (+) Transcript_27301:1292-1534(+)
MNRRLATKTKARTPTRPTRPMIPLLRKASILAGRHVSVDVDVDVDGDGTARHAGHEVVVVVAEDEVEDGREVDLHLVGVR